jgi:hypothetical protein
LGADLPSKGFRLDGEFCKGLRMPAMTTAPHAPTAGVGKASMQEVAEGEAPFGAAGSMAI